MLRWATRGWRSLDGIGFARVGAEGAIKFAPVARRAGGVNVRFDRREFIAPGLRVANARPCHSGRAFARGLTASSARSVA